MDTDNALNHNLINHRQYDVLDEALAARPNLVAPENLAAQIMARIETVAQFDAIDLALAERPPLQAPDNLTANVMAKIQAVPQFDRLDQLLAERPPLQAPETVTANVMARIEKVAQEDVLDQLLAKRPSLQASRATVSNVMARIEIAGVEQQITLEQALAKRPPLQAPRTTAASVLARISNLPQEASQALPLAAIEAQPITSPIKYYPPKVVQPLPEVEELTLQPNRHLRFALLSASWVTLCLASLYMVWPAVSNLIFGPSTDPNMMARLAFLEGWWNNFTGIISSFVQTTITYWPSILSMAAGIIVLLIIFNFLQQQRLGRE